MNNNSDSFSDEKITRPENLVQLGGNTVASVGMSKTGNDVIEPEDIRNPWLKEAYSAAIEFYDNDKNLTIQDRQELSDKFLYIAKAHAYTGWSLFTIVFGTPFAWKFYKTNAIRGVQVPRNFVVGIAAMIFGAVTGGKYAYNSTLTGLQKSIYEDNIGDKSFRQYQILKLISPGESPKWAMYYKNTSMNPARAVKDPKTLLATVQEKLDSNNGQPPLSPFMHQRDVLNLYSGPEFDKYKQDQKHNDYPASLAQQDQQQQQPPLASTTDNKYNNNTQPSDLLDTNNEKSLQDADNDDPFFQEEGNKKSGASGSAWDKIRNSKNP